MEIFYEKMNESLNKNSKKIFINFLQKGQSTEELTYGDLEIFSNKAANHLLSLGVKKSEPVILFMPKSIHFIIFYLALQKIGAIAVPINHQFGKTEMKYFLKDTKTNFVISGKAQATLINDISQNVKNVVLNTNQLVSENRDLINISDDGPEVDMIEDDPSLILYTSGTTGSPKGAIITQKNLINDAQNIINTWEINGLDALCHCLPLFHIHGLCFAFHTLLLAGGRITMLDEFDVDITINNLAFNKGPCVCNIFMAVPTMYIKMLERMEGKKALNFEHLRLLTSGSAPLLESDFERIQKIFGKEPVEREGMTETGMNFSNPIHGKKKPGSIGIPLPNLEVRIVNPDKGVGVEEGTIGEFWLKSPSIISAYWNKAEETKKAFHDGWFTTGDLGRCDQEGFFYLTDRLKNIIISGGENISPKEIETIINQIEEVLESSVVGIPDSKWGERVVAAVKVKKDSNISQDDVKNFCKVRLHKWKCPKEVAFVSYLPKNKMGKILKNEVRKIFQG